MLTTLTLRLPLVSRTTGSRSRIIIALLLIALVSSGCVTKYALKQDQAREAATSGDFTKAAAVYLSDKDPKDHVDVLLNRGLARFETSDFDGMENDLRRAEERIDELFTKSISKAALSLISNDRALAYTGTNLERGMLHYYRALGFYANRKYEDASIESRALTKYLEQLPGFTKRAYRDDGFLRYFGGVGYDLAWQANDAWIAYENARRAYPKSLGEVPKFVVPVSAFAAKRTGVISKDSLQLVTSVVPDSAHGRLLVFVETGVISGLEPEYITIPIYEKEEDRSYGLDFDWDEWGRELDHRCHYGPQYRVVDWIAIAIPKVTHNGSSAISQVRVGWDGHDTTAALASNLSMNFESEFSDQRPAILARTLARTIAKKATENSAKKEGGEGLFWLVKAINTATEIADTRSWAILPDKIHVLDMAVPVGKYSMNVRGLQSGGAMMDSTVLSNVEILPGKITIKRVRLRG